MKSTGICFDLFNTLVNVGQVPAEIGRYTADILGIERQAWRDACFGPEHDICESSDALHSLRKLAHSINPDIPLPTIAAAVLERQRRFDHALQHIEPEVCEVLRELRDRGHRLALVSNASTAEVSSWPASPLAELFEVAVFSCECGARKPQPGIYAHALAQLGLSGEECLFVGDGGSEEHQGAYAMGMLPVLLTRHVLPQELEQRRRQYADVLYREIADISELLEICR